MITFRPLAPGDIPVVKSWTPYPEEFSELDYSLRDDGWLDHYRPGVGTEIFVGEDSTGIVGFTILTREDGICPEFRIALNPEKLGQGNGRTLTGLTLVQAFSRADCPCVRLIVRRNNLRAQTLYDQLGFQRTGECVEDVQGKPVAFYRMELSRGNFHGVNQK
jgi:diamine N-acetyltransferase